MAEAAENTSTVSLNSLFAMPLVRQIALLVGLAAAVAAGIVAALWLQEPSYRPLFTQLSGRDAGEVVDALRGSEIPFRIDDSSGAILVPPGEVHEARMKLAAMGLPQGSSMGLEMLHKKQELGTSQFMESARYTHALETDLGRSIATMRNVDTARVHLAVPKQSVFVRKRTKPTASVLVKLYPGRTLEAGQVSAIVHLVSSSIPQLEAGQVTLVDQMGRLLTDSRDNRDLALTARQFKYTEQVEDSYGARVAKLLEPIVGMGRVRAQVTADMDFSTTESTREAYDPERRALRSEQINEQGSRAADQAQGIPGALSNQPPGAGTTDADAYANDALEGSPLNHSRSATRNFEVDRVVSHTRQGSGALKRLAVAVIIDDQTVLGDDGTTTRQPYSEAQLARFTTLVKESIGFSEVRGDSVQVINSSFLQPEIADIPEGPVWKEPWVMDLAKQVFGGIFILVILLTVVRPIIKNLTAPAATAVRARIADKGAKRNGLSGNGLSQGQLAQDQVSLGGGAVPAGIPDLNAPKAYDAKLNYAQSVVNVDPARVANVVKGWVASDG
jgi:flagellar M-ring protein FliF